MKQLRSAQMRWLIVLDDVIDDKLEENRENKFARKCRDETFVFHLNGSLFNKLESKNSTFLKGKYYFIQLLPSPALPSRNEKIPIAVIYN